MDSVGKFLRLKRVRANETSRRGIRGKGHCGTPGSLKSDNAADAISLGRDQVRIAKLPYYLKYSKIREIINSAAGLCDRSTYSLWRKKI